MMRPAFDTEYHALRFAVSKLEEYKRVQEHEQSLLVIVRTLKNEKGALQIQVIQQQREMEEINAKLRVQEIGVESLKETRRAILATNARFKQELAHTKEENERLQGVVARLQQKLQQVFQKAMEEPVDHVNDTQFKTMHDAGFVIIKTTGKYVYWSKDKFVIGFKRTDGVTTQWLIGRLTKNA